MTSKQEELESALTELKEDLKSEKDAKKKTTLKKKITKAEKQLKDFVAIVSEDKPAKKAEPVKTEPVKKAVEKGTASLFFNESFWSPQLNKSIKKGVLNVETDSEVYEILAPKAQKITPLNGGFNVGTK